MLVNVRSFTCPGTRVLCEMFYVMRDGEQLCNVAAGKDLGVYVDERLSFGTHVTKSVKLILLTR